MPSTLPKPFLGSIKSFLRPIKKWPRALFSDSVKASAPFEAWVAEGSEKSSGLPLIFAYAGLERHKNYFFHMAFQPGYQETPLKEGSPAEIEAQIKSAHSNCQALLFEADSARAKLFPAGEYQYKIPVWARWELTVGAGWEELNKEKGMTQMRRLLNRNEFNYEITREVRDFEDFYQNLYVPFTLKKHGDTAFVHSYEEAKAKFQNGELMLVKDGDSIVGGIVLEYSATRCIPTCICIHQNRMDLLQNGLLSAMLYQTFLRAREKNFEVVDLGFTRAFLKDGVVRFKNRMGARLVDYHQKTGYLTFKILNVTPSLKAFFSANPFIETREDSKLSAVMFREQMPETAGIDEMLKDTFCSGLEELDIYIFAKDATNEKPAFTWGRQDLKNVRILNFHELA